MQEGNLDITLCFSNPKVNQEGKPRPIFIKFAHYVCTVYKNKKLKHKKNSNHRKFNSNTCWFIERNAR